MSVYSFTTFDDPLTNTGGTVAWGINDLDQIVGNYSQTAQFHGFVKKAGTYSTLDDPLAGRDGGTVATGINTSGQIVGAHAPEHGSESLLS